jgi:hypothetical protein
LLIKLLRVGHGEFTKGATMAAGIKVADLQVLGFENKVAAAFAAGEPDSGISLMLNEFHLSPSELFLFL